MTEQDKEEYRDTVKACISDLVADLFYYDRKEDEELGQVVWDELLENEVFTKDELAKWFSEEVLRWYS